MAAAAGLDVGDLRHGDLGVVASETESRVKQFRRRDAVPMAAVVVLF
jgi:hypothetical protein